MRPTCRREAADDPSRALSRPHRRGGSVCAGLSERRGKRRGKEDADAFQRAAWHARRRAPDGPLVWVHAASVGEAASVLALIERMLVRAARPGSPDHHRHGHLGAAARDAVCRAARGTNSCRSTCPRAVGRFLDHWRPDLAVWVESELWPNLVLMTRRRSIPMLLLNARLSARSHAALARGAGPDPADAGDRSRCAWRRTRCRRAASASSAPRRWRASATSNRRRAPACRCRGDWRR